MAVPLDDRVLEELGALQKLARSIRDDPEYLSEASSTENVHFACTSSRPASRRPAHQSHTRKWTTLATHMSCRSHSPAASIISSPLSLRKKASLLSFSSFRSKQCGDDSPAVRDMACASFYGHREVQDGGPDGVLGVLAAAVHESLQNKCPEEPFHTNDLQGEHTKVMMNTLAAIPTCLKQRMAYLCASVDRL
jgi:hypothetical protein